MAVPLKEIRRGDPAPSLTTETLPEAFPETVGANLTLRVATWEALSVNGAVAPLTLKLLPVAVTLLTFTATVPVFFRVIVCDELLPRDTLEKLKLPGVAVSCPRGVVEPVPVSETVVVGLFGSLLVSVILPGTVPAAVGANVTVTGTD